MDTVEIDGVPIRYVVDGGGGSSPLIVDDVVGLGDHLGLSRFTVLGHSYGAFVAQELALRPPRSSGRDGARQRDAGPARVG